MKMIASFLNNYAAYDIKEPATLEERQRVATACKIKLLDDMTVLVDKMDNQINDTYVGWPTRTYFIDREGRIQFDSGPGPYGLSHETLDEKISDYLLYN